MNLNFIYKTVFCIKVQPKKFSWRNEPTSFDCIFSDHLTRWGGRLCICVFKWAGSIWISLQWLEDVMLNARGSHVVSVKSCIFTTRCSSRWTLYLSCSAPTRRLLPSWNGSCVLAGGEYLLQCDVFMDLNIRRQKCFALSSQQSWVSQEVRRWWF